MSNSATSNSANANLEVGSGYLEISEKGFGFLRSSDHHFQPKPVDIFVTPDTIKKCFLREGCLVEGPTQPPHRGTSPQLKEVYSVNGMAFADYTKAMRFENLTTIDPTEKFRLETAPDLIETRIIDLVTPIGKGTRGLIVEPSAAKNPQPNDRAMPKPPSLVALPPRPMRICRAPCSVASRMTAPRPAVSRSNGWCRPAGSRARPMT